MDDKNTDGNKTWKSQVQAVDGLSGIDLSDHINSSEEFLSLLKEVAPEVIDILGHEIDQLFNMLKQKKDGVDVVTTDQFIKFIEDLDIDKDGVITEKEVYKKMDKNNNKKIDYDEIKKFMDTHVNKT